MTEILVAVRGETLTDLEIFKALLRKAGEQFEVSEEYAPEIRLNIQDYERDLDGDVLLGMNIVLLFHEDGTFFEAFVGREPFGAEFGCDEGED